MSHATDSLESAIGNALFLGSPFPTITQWTVHLFTSLPGEGGSGGNEVPINGTNGYQPVRHDPSPEHWMKDDSQQSGTTVYRNKLPVQFPAALAHWGTINGFGLKDQNGQLRYIAPTNTRSVPAGEQPVFLSGELVFTIG